jgi:hypothetical protein
MPDCILSLSVQANHDSPAKAHQPLRGNFVKARFDGQGNLIRNSFHHPAHLFILSILIQTTGTCVIATASIAILPLITNIFHPHWRVHSIFV